MQFEDYIQSLMASVKYQNYIAAHPNNPKIILPHIEGDPAADFGVEWVEAWKRTENYRIWNANTDSHLFDIVDPKHPCAGGLTIDDVQRRIAQQVQELHLDERFAQGREVLGRNLAAGKEKASVMFNKLYTDMEVFRETQRRRAEEARAVQGNSGRTDRNGGTPFSNVDLGKAQQTVQSVGVKAGAYMSSWATWAGEKRKAGWGIGGGGKPKGKTGENGVSSRETAPTLEKEYTMVSTGGNRLSGSSATTDDGDRQTRPLTQGSYAESLFSAGSGSAPPSPQKERRGRPLSGDSIPPTTSFSDEPQPAPAPAEELPVRKGFLAFYRDEPREDADKGGAGPETPKATEAPRGPTDPAAQKEGADTSKMQRWDRQADGESRGLVM